MIKSASFLLALTVSLIAVASGQGSDQAVSPANVVPSIPQMPMPQVPSGQQMQGAINQPMQQPRNSFLSGLLGQNANIGDTIRQLPQRAMSTISSVFGNVRNMLSGLGRGPQQLQASQMQQMPQQMAHYGNNQGLNGLTNGLNGALPQLNGLTNGLNGLTNSLNGAVPQLNGLTSGLTNGLPQLNSLTSGLPQLNSLTNGLPQLNSLTNGLPQLNSLTNGLPKLDGLTNGLPVRNLPNVGNIVNQASSSLNGLTKPVTDSLVQAGLPDLSQTTNQLTQGLSKTLSGIVPSQLVQH